MRVLRKVFKLEPYEWCAKAVDKEGKRMPSYDMPLWDKAEELLMEQLNDWIETVESNIKIISINMNIPTLEIFYQI